ncbi:MAG TPA: hypothetical protein ENN07_06275 [candidate division Zixibacteria bacterium]|nr:hypothetical protein [candidate division Zixibacteria bacterium]
MIMKSETLNVKNLFRLLKGRSMTSNKLAGRMIYIAMLFAIFVGASFAQLDNSFESARAAGLAGAYLTIGDDASAIASNPSGLMRIDRTQLTGSYTRFFTGAGIPTLQEGSVYFSPFMWNRFFVGVGANYFMHDIYNQQMGTLVIGREIYRKGRNVRLGLAVNANLYRIDYNTAHFSDDFEHGDPVFRDGYNKMTYGADFSMLADIGAASIGVKALNLNEPDISLRGGAAGGRLPRKVLAGMAYNILDYVTPTVEVEVPISDEVGVADEMSVAFGAESWFLNRMLATRAGFSTMIGSESESKGSLVSLGMSFRSRTEWDAGLDYAIQIPIDSPVEIGQTHKVSMGIGMRKPVRVITDLAVVPNSVRAVPEHVTPGTPARVSAVITNLGDMDARNFPMSLYYFVDGKPVVADQITIDELAVGEELQVSLEFVSTKAGRFELFASVNDYGNRAPAVNNKVLEWDLDNNTGATELDCFGPPVFDGEIATSRDEIEISTISRVREEAPMVPMIFFDAGADNVRQSRFDNILRTIADRLKRNPDATLELRGHYDAIGESAEGRDLAIRRARKVRDYLVGLGVSAGQVVVIDDGYDFAADLVKGVSGEFRSKISEENRNVDMKIRLTEETIICEYIFDEGEYIPRGDGLDACIKRLEGLISFLDRNPDVNIVFRGRANCLEQVCLKDAFIRASELRRIADRNIPDRLSSRMFVLSSDWTSDVEDPRVEVVLDGDAIIFRPRGSMAGRDALEFSELGEIEVSIAPVRSEVEIDSFAIYVVEEGAEEPFAILTAGKGAPPSSVNWTWFGVAGQPPDPEKRYNVEVFAEDVYGQSAKARSKPIGVKVQEQEERRELFIISFNFGKADATSEFLEARVAALADRLAERAKYLGPNAKIKATVIGHTDTVGSPRANRELSIERARKEYISLRHGLMQVLGLKNEEELDGWLRSHRVELSYEGRSFEEPMTVSYWEQGYWRTQLVGDNEVPEGRLVNRRVVLEVLTVTREE